MSGGLSLKMEIDDEELKKYLKEMERRGENLRPLLKRYSVLMLRSFALNFRSEGRPRRWKSLAPNTIAGRRKGSKRVLQNTGRLRLSATSKSGSDNVHHMTADSLRMGTKMRIASYHQYGTNPYTILPRNKKLLSFMTTSGRVFARSVRHPGLPARPFIMIHREDEQAMMEQALEYMTKD